MVLKMSDINSFTEVLREVREIVRTAANGLTKEEILNYFSDMELSREQEEMIYQYVLTPQEESENDSDGENGQEELDEDKISSEEAQFPHSAIFQMYMEELNDLENYTSKELDVLYERLMQGDEDVINQISQAWLKKVCDHSKRYISEKYNIEDVIQEGNMALFIELTNICEEKQKTDVEKQLLEAIDIAMRNYISEITGEEDSQNTVVGKVQLVNEAKNYLTQLNGTVPSIEELAEYTKLSVDELKDIDELIGKAKRDNN